eukprot:15462955-Alexandrium_andersonii.AAC.1
MTEAITAGFMQGMTRGLLVQPRWDYCPVWLKISSGGEGNSSLRSLYTRALVSACCLSVHCLIRHC